MKLTPSQIHAYYAAFCQAVGDLGYDWPIAGISRGDIHMTFLVTSPFGIMQVSMVTPKHPQLMGTIALRFLERDKVNGQKPPIAPDDFCPTSLKWNITRDSWRENIAELRRRLQWAGPAPSSLEQSKIYADITAQRARQRTPLTTLLVVMSRASAALLADTDSRVQGGGRAANRRPVDAFDVNCGLCEEWAELVRKLFQQETGMDLVQVLDAGALTGDLNDSLRFAHVFIRFEGKFYDAECLTGVEDWHNLPIIQRAFRCELAPTS